MLTQCIVCLLPITYVLWSCILLWQNIQSARASGLIYIIVPFYPYNRLALLLTRPLFLLADKFSPNPGPASWRRLVGSGWLWKCRQATFFELGTDSFLVVSPGGIVMYTADANVITQVVSRDTDFPKATALYKPIDLYGPNVVSSDGLEWRRQRKITSQSFSENTNELVWKETLLQTRTMVASWIAGTDGCSKTITQLADDTMRLSLSVISRAILGQKMDWSWGGDNCEMIMDQETPGGHTMSFTSSLQFLLGHIFYLMLFPKWLLRILPLKIMKKCYQASDELHRYMLEMTSAKRDALYENNAVDQIPTDLISQLLKTDKSISGKQKMGTDSSALTESEVIGNLFIFFIAGHETSANSIHFCLLLLALRPKIQRKVQKELDGLFEGRPVGRWDYRRDFARLLNSFLGAVLSEQLRLITPVPSIPKRVGTVPQPLTIEDREVYVPANTIVRLCVHSVHRNPKFWPSGPPKDPLRPYFPPSNLDNDLEEFKPERWLSPNSTWPAATTKMDAEAAQLPRNLYKPPRGAYLPFSAGQRACSGQRFAQVEIMCALAVILSEYSVELSVDTFASDEQVAQMNPTERAQVWDRARDHADAVWQQKMQCVLTLQIRGAYVPVRFVKRGLEKFGEMGL